MEKLLSLYLIVTILVFCHTSVFGQDQPEFKTMYCL